VTGVDPDIVALKVGARDAAAANLQNTRWIEAKGEEYAPYTSTSTNTNTNTNTSTNTSANSASSSASNRDLGGSSGGGDASVSGGGQALEQYDLIMCLDILHDCPFPDRILANLARLLKPTGTLLIKDIRSTGSFPTDLQKGGSLAMLYGTVLLLRF